jgi:hypothetical protein
MWAMTCARADRGPAPSLRAVPATHLGGVVERSDRVIGGIQGGGLLAGAQHRRQPLAAGWRRWHGWLGRRALERLQADVVGIGEGGFLAADGAHADALLDVEAARFDDALLQAPGLGTRVLEIQVGVIDVVPSSWPKTRSSWCGASPCGRSRVCSAMGIGGSHSRRWARIGPLVMAFMVSRILSPQLATVCGVSAPAGWRGCRQCVAGRFRPPPRLRPCRCGRGPRPRGR